jgi:hypothetical protein
MTDESGTNCPGSDISPTDDECAAWNRLRRMEGDMRIVSAALAAFILSVPAGAANILGFEGVNPTYPSGSAQILNFYDGGLSSAGTSGANFGISFSSNAVAVCLNSTTIICSNASTGGLVPTSNKGALGLASNGVAIMDFSTAYTGAVGFRYAIASGVAFIKAYDGVGGTGTQLANLPLFANAIGCPAYSATLCIFGPGGLGFLTNARSLVFGGMAGGVVWDDITLGAGNDPLPPPALPVPEAAGWMLMVAGFGLVGVGLRFQRASPRRKLGSRDA